MQKFQSNNLWLFNQVNFSKNFTGIMNFSRSFIRGMTNPGNTQIQLKDSEKIPQKTNKVVLFSNFLLIIGGVAVPVIASIAKHVYNH